MEHGRRGSDGQHPFFETKFDATGREGVVPHADRPQSERPDDADQATEGERGEMLGDAPPVFVMPDGLTYFHIRRNGLVLGASSARNVSPNTVLEVGFFVSWLFRYQNTYITVSYHFSSSLIYNKIAPYAKSEAYVSF